MRRRLIVNADDFGASTSINRAVILAHHHGILTTASLMVNGAAADEALALARENPKLGVGLHLSLAFGTSTLPSSEIPDLVDAKGNFSNDPVAAGCKYFFNPRCREQIEREVTAQFEKFKATGLKLDHLNGHLHFHLHPTVFKIISKWPVNSVRLTREPFWLNAKIASGRWFYRISHAIIFRLLSARSRPALDRMNARYTDRVFGLLQNGLVNERYVCALLQRLPAGDSELYSHPSLDEFKHEYDALIATRDLVKDLGIELIRYQDL